MKNVFNLSNVTLVELSDDDLNMINGGSGPTTESSFAYDFFYWVGRSISFVGAALEDAVNNPIRPSEYR